MNDYQQGLNEINQLKADLAQGRSEYEMFQKACKVPVDLEKCHKALQLLIDGKHSLHVPPQLDDADILLSRALRELKEYRESNPR